MTIRAFRAAAAIAVTCVWPMLHGSAAGQPGETGKAAEAAKVETPPKFRPSITTHRVTIGGREVEYTARAGLTEMRDYDGKLKAHIFSVSYVRTPREGERPQDRPVLFSFNGGPGSSSVWMHLGMSGPRRVRFADPKESAGTPSLPRPPYELIDNEHSWLDLFDLVYIDPVSTGYSRPAEGVAKSEFHGLEEDVRWVGDFIRLWITQEKRWLSPKYLIGASYGTTRAGGLSGYLQDTHGMFLSGAILVSPVLNFGTLRFDPGNDTPYWLYVPTYAAIAHYHGRLSPRLQALPVREVIRQAEEFASTEYQLALSAGDRLSGEQRAAVAARLSEFTGLSRSFVELAGLRVTNMAFAKELLRDQGRTIGRLDARFKGFDRSGVTAQFDYDPSYSAIQGPFTAALNHYLRAELRYENDDPYEILTGRVQPWSFDAWENRYADTADTLRAAISKNNALRVLVLAGYYDLATPHMASDYTFDRLGLHESLRGNVVRRYYEAGHMPYIRESELVRLKQDVAEFLGGAQHNER